jgi:hypothetical protein
MSTKIVCQVIGFDAGNPIPGSFNDPFHDFGDENPICRFWFNSFWSFQKWISTMHR